MRWLEAVLIRREEEKEEADGGAVHYVSIDGVATDATWQPAPQAKAWPEEDHLMEKLRSSSFLRTAWQWTLVASAFSCTSWMSRAGPHASWALTAVSHGWNERLQRWKENRNWDLILWKEESLPLVLFLVAQSMMGFFIYVDTCRSIFIIKNLYISAVQNF